MKQFKSYFAFLLIIFACISLTACSDDDGPKGGDDDNAEEVVNPKQVFENGIPKQVGDMQITTNAQGLVTEIVDGDKTATFIYNDENSGTKKVASRAAQDYDVKLLIKNNHGDEYDHGYTTYYIKLNNKGFMTCATEDDGDKTWFEYNTDWQVNQVRYEEKPPYDDNETGKVTYANGNIVAMDYYDKNGKPLPQGDGNHYKFEYGANPIPNKGGIMLFDECFGFDINELEYVYYAGMMGKGTKNLPTKLIEGEGQSDGWSMNFEWVLNPQGLPIQLRSYEDGFEQDPNITDFRW